MKAFWRNSVAALLLAMTGTAPAQNGAPDKSMFILLDTSGSMSGAGIAMAQSAVGTLLDEMAFDSEYRLALIKGTGGNVVVPLGANNIGHIRPHINLDQSSGNPTTTLEQFTNQVLSRTPGCHIALLVTDGDDGSNPLGPAEAIKNQCSRLFVVGVALGAHAESVLSNIAAVGGGRYCNGSDTEGLTRCILSVFKVYQFDESLGYCVSPIGVPGVNPMPRLERLVRMRDWECYDFSGQDFTINGLQSKIGQAFANGGPRLSVRGSHFTGANLEGVYLRQPFSGARFRNARMAKATLYASGGTTDHVDFSGADLSGATLSGGGSSCARDWDLTGANLAGSEWHRLKLCGVKLSGSVTATFHDVDLRGVRVDSGLVMLYAKGSALRMADVSGAYLQFVSSDLSDTVLETLRLETLAIRSAQGSKDDGSLSVRDLKATSSVLVDGGWFSELRLAAISTPSLKLEAVNGPVSIDKSLVTDATIRATEIELVETRLDRASITEFWNVGFSELSHCGACTLSPALQRDVKLTIDSSTLTGLVVEASPQSRDLLLDARKANLKGSRWKSVRWAPDSSLEQVELNGSNFENTPLKLVMSGVRLSESVFNASPLVLLDGSRDLECARCGKITVDFQTEIVKKLRLPATESTFLFASLGAVEIGELDVSQGILQPVGGYKNMTCRDCKFEDATLKGGLEGVTLLKPNGSRAKLLDLNGALEIRGGNFRAANFKGPLQGTFDQVDFSEAEFQDSVKGEFSGALFLRAKFLNGMVESEVRNSDFSQASFPSLTSALRKSTFVRSKFSGATFVSSTLGHSEDVVFENCWFDGQYGAVTLKNLLSGAPGMKVSNANWAGADLSELKLSRVEWVSVNLNGAKLYNVGLTDAKLEDVNLAGADLTAAQLHGEISNTTLHKARVGGASFSGTYSGIDLSHLVEAERVEHFTADLDDAVLSGSDLHNAHVAFGSDRRTYRRLTLTDAVISCEMLDVIREQGTVTYGSHRAMPWDALGWQECPAPKPGS